MNTQISLIVKKDTFMSRYMFSSWVRLFLKKTAISMVLNGIRSEELKPNKEPYIFDVQPGKHEITFIDINANEKRLMGRIGVAFITLMWSWIGGLSASIATLAAGDAMDAYDGVVRKGVLRVELKEGDLLRISAQPNVFGNIKIKVLN